MRKEEIVYNKGYRVNVDGVPINHHGNVMSFHINVAGYKMLGIRVNGVYYNISIHRLQAFQKYRYELFKIGIVARHLNNLKTDNRYENIGIGTSKQNSMDNDPKDRIRWSKYASSFLIKHNKKPIIDFYNKCNSYKITMKEFNISSKGTLWHILNKRNK